MNILNREINHFSNALQANGYTKEVVKYVGICIQKDQNKKEETSKTTVFLDYRSEVTDRIGQLLTKAK